MTLQLSTRTIDTLGGDAKLKQVKVLVCTETCTLAGYMYCMNHQRLSDVLNQGSVTNSLPIGKDFVPLTKVEVTFPNLERESLASICVRKASILFVCENSDGQLDVSEIKDRPKIYPVRAKTPIGAEIHMPSYTLTGQIYAEVWQQILDIVDRSDKFLPLTNVEIYPPLDNTAVKFDFVAVNREKIIYVCESLKCPQSPL